MNPRKCTFITAAFSMGLLVHFLSTIKFFRSNTSSNSYFSLGMTLTFVYLFLTAIAFVITVILPLEIEGKQSRLDVVSINWWWHIYLGGWILLGFISLEYYLLKVVSLKMGTALFDYTIFFFIVKGFFLIPAYFLQQKNNHRTSLIVSLGFIEILCMVVGFGMLWMAGQMVPDFGS